MMQFVSLKFFFFFLRDFLQTFAIVKELTGFSISGLPNFLNANVNLSKIDYSC